MHKKGLFFCVLLLVSALLILSCGGQQEQQQTEIGDAQRKVVLKVASVLPADHPSSRALEFFKTRLGELSAGSMEVQLFLNSQLGDASEAIQNCRNGNIELVFASIAPLAQFVPELNALGMPYIYRNKEHEYAVVDGAMGKRLSEKLESFNLHNLCYFDAGTRNIMTKKGPIEKPEDLKGMKIRVMPSRLMVDTINLMGASAIAMSQGEVYSALQTGVLDGWENNPPTCLSFKMYETGCIYYAWTRHLAVPDLLLINADFYTNLTDEQRDWINMTATETIEKQRQLWRENEQKAVDTLKENGMLFNEVDISLFAARVEPVYEQAYKKYGAEFEEICKAIKEIP